jgi:hypothetical protein
MLGAEWSNQETPDLEGRARLRKTAWLPFVQGILTWKVAPQARSTRRY